MFDAKHQKGINPYDYGFLYGFSLFETFLAREDGSVVLLEEHLVRILKSLDYFNIDINMDRETLLNYICHYITENKINNKVVRLTISNGNKIQDIKPSVVLTTRDYIRNDSSYKLMVSSIKKDVHSIIIRHKTSNYLENLLEAQNATKQGFDDAIFLNNENSLAETAKCNLFFVENNVVKTPHVECGILSGITRQWAIEQINKFGLQIIEGSFSIEDLKKADEIFVTNSVIGIKEVNNIDGLIVGKPAIHTVTNNLINQYFNI